MKGFLSLFAFIPFLLEAQSAFPTFLTGTWKAEHGDTYEHWNRLSDNHLKGISYKYKNGQIQVTEYVEIVVKKKKLVYKASVVGQNKGQRISFTRTDSGNSYVFENKKHDFPKKIEYIQTGSHEMAVNLSDNTGKEQRLLYTRYPEKPETTDTTIQNPRYDRALAEKLGGDAYGMKSYVFVILKTGPNETTDKEFISRCFKDHMSNIKQLVSESKLVIAGPMQKNDIGYRGIFILNTTDFEEAKAMMRPDSAIQEGLLEPVLFKWYGSAALPEYLDASDKIWKSSF